MKKNRREFLKFFTTGLASLWAGYLLWASKNLFFFSPKKGLLHIGKCTVLKNNQKVQELESHFLVKEPDGYRLLSRICSHKGCLLTTDMNSFICPCHEGIFTPNGIPLDGKPTEPLTRYVLIVKDDDLFADLSQSIPLSAPGLIL